MSGSGRSVCSPFRFAGEGWGASLFSGVLPYALSPSLFLLGREPSVFLHPKVQRTAEPPVAAHSDRATWRFVGYGCWWSLVALIYGFIRTTTAPSSPRFSRWSSCLCLLLWLWIFLRVVDLRLRVRRATIFADPAC